MLCAQICPVCFPNSIATLISLIRHNGPVHGSLWHACMHASSCAWGELCPACYPDSINTLISLIQLNLTELWAHTGPACSPNSIDTSIFLIWPNSAEIWASACKHIACIHASLPAQDILCAQTGPARSPDSIDTLISLIRPNMGLSTPENGAPAR